MPVMTRAESADDMLASQRAMGSTPADGLVVGVPEVSAFEAGSRAGQQAEASANPYAAGSREHGNYDVGWRFGSSILARRGSDVLDFFHRLD